MKFVTVPALCDGDVDYDGDDDYVAPLPVEVEGGGDGRGGEDEGVQEPHHCRVQVLRPGTMSPKLCSSDSSSVPLLGLVVQIEIEDGGDVAQARSQDAKANERQGETVMCDNNSIKL